HGVEYQQQAGKRRARLLLLARMVQIPEGHIDVGKLGLRHVAVTAKPQLVGKPVAIGAAEHRLRQRLGGNQLLHAVVYWFDLLLDVAKIRKLPDELEQEFDRRV